MDTSGSNSEQQTPANQSLEQLVTAKMQAGEKVPVPLPAVEMVPNGPSASIPQPVAGTGQTLTADDVAQAIAAVPMPTAPVVPSTPSTAADQDVVEPEWVNAAEEAITKNIGNPYAEEEAVETLQVDYLKKRYGHEVKKSTGS